MKKTSAPKNPAAREKRERLVALHESMREELRQLPGLSEKKLWGGLAYRYEDQVYFTLTLRPRIVQLEMKLPNEEADLALGLAFVHPHSFTRLARHGWISVSVTPGIPLGRVRELVERSYWSRAETRPKLKRELF